MLFNLLYIFINYYFSKSQSVEAQDSTVEIVRQPALHSSSITPATLILPKLVAALT
jgi:hypothetical protein